MEHEGLEVSKSGEALRQLENGRLDAGGAGAGRKTRCQLNNTSKVLRLHAPLNEQRPEGYGETTFGYTDYPFLSRNAEARLALAE
jgi:hypothetical protein